MWDHVSHLNFEVTLPLKFHHLVANYLKTFDPDVTQSITPRRCILTLTRCGASWRVSWKCGSVSLQVIQECFRTCSAVYRWWGSTWSIWDSRSWNTEKHPVLKVCEERTVSLLETYMLCKFNYCVAINMTGWCFTDGFVLIKTNKKKMLPLLFSHQFYSHILSLPLQNHRTKYDQM